MICSCCKRETVSQWDHWSTADMEFWCPPTMERGEKLPIVKTISDHQTEVGKWIDKQFPGGAKELSALVLIEEVGEMCRAIVKSAQGIRGGKERWDPEIRKEAGDVLITLLSLAHAFSFDLEASFDEKWAEVGARVVTSPEEQAR